MIQIRQTSLYFLQNIAPILQSLMKNNQIINLVISTDPPPDLWVIINDQRHLIVLRQSDINSVCKWFILSADNLNSEVVPNGTFR